MFAGFVGDQEAEYNGLTRREVQNGLSNPDLNARVRYIDQIGDLGEQAAMTLGLADIVVQLCDPNAEKECAAALVALGKFGKEGAKHIAVAASALQANNELVVAAACKALGYFGEDAEQHAGALAGKTKYWDSSVRAAACSALGMIQASNHKNQIAECLADKENAVVKAACGALANLGTKAESNAGDIAKLLKHKDADLRVAALGYFAKVEGTASKVVNEICSALADDDTIVRNEAVATCIAAGVKNISTKDVAKLLTSKDGGSRCAAAVVLGSSEGNAKEHAAGIAKLLDDDYIDKQSRMLSAACVIGKQQASLRIAKCAAAEALSRFGSGGEQYAEKVSKLLADTNAEVRQYAAEALGKMGSAGAKYEDEVMKLFTDTNLNTSSTAIVAVGHMGITIGNSGPATVETVVKLLKSQHPCIRASAATALGMMGETVLVYIDKLVKCFDDRCGLVRAAVNGAVAKLGVRGHMYAVNVGKSLDDPDVHVRLSALAALALMGDRGAALMEEIADRLYDAESDVRAAALRTIGSFGSEAWQLREAVEMMKADPVESVRNAASEVEGKLQ